MRKKELSTSKSRVRDKDTTPTAKFTINQHDSNDNHWQFVQGKQPGEAQLECVLRLEQQELREHYCDVRVSL
jgi:hypothetical protein